MRSILCPCTMEAELDARAVDDKYLTVDFGRKIEK